MPPRRTVVMYDSGANGFRFNATLILHIGDRSRTERGGIKNIMLEFHDVKLYVNGWLGRVGGA